MCILTPPSLHLGISNSALWWLQIPASASIRCWMAGAMMTFKRDIILTTRQQLFKYPTQYCLGFHCGNPCWLLGISPIPGFHRYPMAPSIKVLSPCSPSLSIPHLEHRVLSSFPPLSFYPHLLLFQIYFSLNPYFPIFLRWSYLFSLTTGICVCFPCYLASLCHGL